MTITDAKLYKKFGCVFFFFIVKDIEYVLCIHQEFSHGLILKNKRTKSFIDFKANDLFCQKMLLLVDALLEQEKEMFSDNEEMIKKINQSKKYYYNSIKSHMSDYGKNYQIRYK